MSAIERRAFSAPLGLDVVVIVDGGALTRLSLARPAAGSPSWIDEPILARVLAHLESGKDDLGDVPVRLDVPAFHARALARLRSIPPGETASYGEIARELGSVARAVGGACAGNPIPLVIPCHRVVGADGSLVHFGCEGGVATKRRLLEIEGAWPLRARGQARLF